MNAIGGTADHARARSQRAKFDPERTSHRVGERLRDLLVCFHARRLAHAARSYVIIASSTVLPTRAALTCSRQSDDMAQPFSAEPSNHSRRARLDMLTGSLIRPLGPQTVICQLETRILDRILVRSPISEILMPARVFTKGVPPQRIRTFLILFALALTVPVLALAAFALNRMAGLEQQEIERRVLQVAQDLAGDIDRELDRATVALETLATSTSACAR